jgi:hypothetical protein
MCPLCCVQVYGLDPPPADIVDEYLHLGTGIPDCLLHKAIVPRSAEDASTLARQYLGEDRMGPANTHGMDPADFMERVTDPSTHHANHDNLFTDVLGKWGVCKTGTQQTSDMQCLQVFYIYVEGE